MDIRDFLEARLAEDEIWAREASRFSAEPDREGHTVPDLPNGMHWRWGYGDQWAEVVPDMSIDPQMNKLPDPDGWYSVTLVSVETWQWEHAHGRVWEMHEQVIDGSEVRTAAAGHIARHDPARVLREVAAKRRVLERHRPASHPNYRFYDTDPIVYTCEGCGYDTNSCGEHEPRTEDINDCPELRDIAAIYADHEDYAPKWSVTG